MQIIEKLQDYHREKVFNGILAIEPEIDKDTFSDISKKYGPFKYHTESPRIVEIDNLHTFPLEKREEIIEELRVIYKDTYPRGNNGYASGGVHFHFFFEGDGDITPLVKKQINDTNLGTNMKAFPLFGKIYKDKMFFKPGFSILENSGFNGSKSGLFTERYLRHGRGIDKTTIEFRANNVFDPRIYGYYLALIILATYGHKLSKSTNNLKTMSKQDLPVGNNHISCYDAEGIKIKPKEFSENIHVILATLNKYGFKEAAKQLRNYLIEMNIDNVYTVDYDSSVLYDSLTYDKISIGDKVYILSIGGVKYISKTTKFRGIISNNIIKKPGYQQMELPDFNISLKHIKNEKTYLSLLNS